MILVFLVIVNISIQPEYYTNTNYFYEITGKDSIIYGATNGGVVAYNYSNGSLRVLTNTDGLQINRQSSICLDSSGYIWAGNAMGLTIIKQDFSSLQIGPFRYLTSTNIQEIVCSRDSIYVGSPSGLSFIDTKGTPTDTTDDTVIKISDTEGLPSKNVLSIAVADTLIWVGTDGGLVHFKKDFTSYVQYDVFDGLLSNKINKVFIIDTSVYVGTDQGLNSFQDDHFDTLLFGSGINDINYVGDSLVLVLNPDSQVGFYYQGTLTLAKNGLPYRCKVLSLLNIYGILFSGLGNRYTKDYFGEGIGRYDFDDSIWYIIKNQCISSNHISEITANEHGVFIACGTRGGDSRGFSWLNNDSEWINFTRDSLLSNDKIHRCTTAPDGKVWFGINAFSCSGGDTIMVFSFDPSNDEWNFLRCGYNGMDSTVAVWDIEFDNSNNMYLAIAGPSDRLWTIDSSLNTVYFLGERTPGFNVEIAIDSTSKIWRTIVDAGLIMIDTRNTLFDRSDDERYNYSTTDGLLSNSVRGCAVDKNNILYVATQNGLAIFDGINFSGITNISQQDLLDVELDSEGRVWVMAGDGIYYYDRELNITGGYNFDELNVHVEFIDDPQEIIQVQGFEFDQLRGCFWIGCETGLLKLDVQFDTLVRLDNILIYPNPVVGKDVVYIENIPIDSRVNIYTISGRKIEEDLTVDGVFGRVKWQIPENIGSGLYFALIKSNQGNKVCKFAVIR